VLAPFFDRVVLTTFQNSLRGATTHQLAALLPADQRAQSIQCSASADAWLVAGHWDLALDQLEQAANHAVEPGLRADVAASTGQLEAYRSGPEKAGAVLLDAVDLIEADDPLLFHTGPRRMFSLVSEAIARIVPIERIRWITFGHHFAAIAGPGPLVGPVLAAQFGYLPSTLWIVIGAVLGGCVQDFVILGYSLKRDGRSLGKMARDEIGPVGGLVALAGVLFIMVILIAVLGLVVTDTLYREHPDLP